MILPKKSLGQNFLTSVGAIQKIIASSDYVPGLTILEVGPGRGVLTEALLKKFDKVVAVEKDHELIPFLQEKFAKEIESGQLKLIEGDILELTPANLNLANLDAEREEDEACDEAVHFSTARSKRSLRQSYAPNLRDYAIIANIPYNITGQFLRIWLAPAPSKVEAGLKYMVLMVQKEVAKRVVASDGKESLLSISVKLYGEPKYIETIKRGSFFPIPNVDSAILKITLHLGAELPSKKQEETFFAVLKAGFAHKRKLLLSNLAQEGSTSTLRLNLPATKKAFETCKIDPKARAENLMVEDWRCLVREIL